MRHGRLVLLALALGGATILAAPAASRAADQITFSVPVQLSNLAAEVAKGRVLCFVNGAYSRGGGGPFVSAAGNLAGSGSSDFTIDQTRGEYRGSSITVQVQVPPPPQEWIDLGFTVIVREPPRYVCYLQVATTTSGWYPNRRFSASMEEERSPDFPSWAAFLSPDRGIVRGTLRVMTRSPVTGSPRMLVPAPPARR